MNTVHSSLLKIITTINGKKSEGKSHQMKLDKQFLCGFVSFYLKGKKYMLDWMLFYNPNSKFCLRFDPDVILALSHDNFLGKQEIIENILTACDKYIQEKSFYEWFLEL